MKRLFTLLFTILPIVTYAQSNNLLEIDESSFEPVQTDVLSGVSIDKIGLDPSRRPCARIKMHINRMTKEEIEGISVRPVGGNVVVNKLTVTGQGNGLIIELTAKEATRFYLHHDKYGDSNEVSLNLEGDKEYRIDAALNTTYSIVVSCNKPEAEVYLDDNYKGQISNRYDLTVSDVYPGPHRIRVKFGSISQEQNVEVSSSNIHFRIILDLESAKPQFVAFKISPADANLIIDGKPYMLNRYGEISEALMLNNGTYTYIISAKDYHEEKGTFTVDGDKVDMNVSLKPAHGFLNISGEGVLSGASVYVDDKLIGNAPVKSGRLSSGEHTVRIIKSLYKEYFGTVNIYDGKTTECKPELTADFATVTLKSTAGTDIYVNGTRKGTSPWTGDLRSGVYNFEARKTGHRNSAISQTISATPSVQSYEIPAPAPIVGTVNFISSPMSDVYVDGNNVGRTPLSMDLIIGKHTVSFRKDGFQTQNRSFEVKEGEASTVQVTLEEGKSTSSSNSYSGTSGQGVYTIKYPQSQSGSLVWVYLDGKFMSSTTRQVTIPHGTHIITVEPEAGKFYGRRVVINSSTPEVIDMSNSPRVISSSSVTPYTGSSSGSKTSSYSSSSSSKSSSYSRYNSYSRKKKGWNWFNIGITGDLAYCSPDNFVVGAGMTIRMSKCNSWMIPTIGARYAYNFSGHSVIGLPFVLNFNYGKIWDTTCGIYLGIGVEGLYYPSGFDYKYNVFEDESEEETTYYGMREEGWGYGLVVNIFGVSARHHDFNLYLSADIDTDLLYIGCRYTYFF